ncbi:MAG: hypothetical protein ABIO29_05720 [Sphingomicrobium sp.]
MRLAVVGLLLLTTAVPIVAQTMNAQTFHERATKLKAKGAMALFSMGAVKKLMAEGQAAGEASSARYKADKLAGKPTRYCPPSGRQKMDSDEFMARLAAIPQAERQRMTMTEAVDRIMAVKYPCAKA